MEEKIISFLRIIGPTTPTKVAKNINKETLLASAHLSDLASRGKVKISSLKIGGSPLYYLPGQEAQLYSFAAGNINPKDLQVLDKLKEKQLLREADLDLLHRVALRSLKDFAVPLQVSFNGSTELFWKWHLLSEEEVNKRIEEVLDGHKKIVEVLPQASEDKTGSKTEDKTGGKTEDKTEDKIEDKTEDKKEEQLSLIQKDPETEQLHLRKQTRKRKEVEDTFLPSLESFFKKLRIVVEQKETLRKNAEMNFILTVPTAVGAMKYYCKAKQKNRCDEKDLSSAYMEAQMKKMPLLFLYSNELSKKAEEMMESGAFENITVKRA